MESLTARLAYFLAWLTRGRHRALFVFLLGWAFPPLVLAAQTPSIPRPVPNVIYILSDDSGYGDWGPYGQIRIATPSIARMAREGMLFTNHYAGAPVSAPSRCSILTGMNNGHNLVRGNIEIMPEGQFPLPPATLTAGTLAQGAGADTAVIGKWGLGYPGSTGTPDKEGFGYYYGYLCQRQAQNYFPDHLWENGRRLPMDGKTYSHDLFTERALSWIREETGKGRPFFLYPAYTIPHAALEVPDLGGYADKAWPEAEKRYAAMMTRMDRDIGRILDELSELGIDSRTLVLLASDNGPAAEGGADPRFFDSGGGLRGKKRDLYEGGIRVPLIARWPGSIPAGTRNDQIVMNYDFLPTLAELYGLPAPEGIDGVSMLPALLGRPASESPRRPRPYLYWEFHELGGSQAVRFGDWKAIRHDLRLFPENRRIELFNLADDPHETKNLAASRPDLVETAIEYFKEARTESKDFPLMGRNTLLFGAWNGWLFLVVGAVAGLLVLALRLAARKRLPRPSALGWAAAATCLPLAALSFFLLLWLDSAWFYAGTAATVAGILAGSGGTIALAFRKQARTGRLPGILAAGGVELFWLGIGIATASKLYLLLWLAGLPLRLIALRRAKSRGRGDIAPLPGRS